MLEAAKWWAAIFLTALCLVPCALAREAIPHGTFNQTMGYHSTSSGDPLAGNGALVTVSSDTAEASAHGGIIYRTGSAHWSGKVAQLSAVVEATTPQARPALWLRADDDAGKLLGFASSADLRAPTDGHLSIDMRVPAEATTLVFGVVMQGPGTTHAKGLKLVQEERALPGGEASARQVYDAAEKVVREHAYWASRLDAQPRDPGMEFSSEPGTGYQAKAAIRALLLALNDSHSFYMGAEEAHRYSNSGAPSSSAEVRLLDGQVGYVRVPGYRGTDPVMAKAFANQVDARLQELHAGARCGWVVDLRKNPGGSMWPMISALGRFFGNEPLGGFKAPDGRIRWWSLRSPAVTPVPGASTARDARVAVLLGPGTASSGEAVAVAFVGRPATRSFGAPTNGRASSNQRFDLPDGSAILLTTAMDVDRTGSEVGQRIVPDTTLADEIVASDRIPEEAMRWLGSACTR